MNISLFIKLYLIALPVFFAVDLLWLGVLARGIYNKYIGDFLASPPNWTAAILFYLMFIVGIIFFAVYPAVEKNSAQHALLYGALFGFFTYMTYEMTNLAVIKDWPLAIVPIDILWGVVLSASVAGITWWVATSLNIN